eukprot:355734-Chlamydomonas_euryale.AAC.1
MAAAAAAAATASHTKAEVARLHSTSVCAPEPVRVAAAAGCPPCGGEGVCGGPDPTLSIFLEGLALDAAASEVPSQGCVYVARTAADARGGKPHQLRV